MIVGIDLGGTKVAMAMAEDNGDIVAQRSFATPRDTNALVAEIKLNLGALGAAEGQVERIGLGIPGQADKNGVVFNMPNLPFLVGNNLINKIKEAFAAEIVVENDANAAALAELKYGAGKGLTDFIYVTVSTGIGGGIIINGSLYSGAHNTAGEIGHMVILPNGPKCGCGNSGCWEALGSGTALAKMAKAKVLSGQKTVLTELINGDIDSLKSEHVVAAAKRGDAVALELLDANGFYNAQGITNLVNLFDPQAIIIGGGLSMAAEYFWGPLHKGLKSFKLMAPNGKVNLLKAGCSKDAGVLGALSLVLK